MMLSVDQWPWQNHIQYYHCYHFQYNYHHHIISSIILTLNPKEPIDVLLLSFIIVYWLMVVCGLSFLWFWFYFSASSCTYFSWLLQFSRKSLIDEYCNISPQAATCCLEWQAVGPLFPLLPPQVLPMFVQCSAEGGPNSLICYIKPLKNFNDISWFIAKAFAFRDGIKKGIFRLN